jgi:hypothetical protein
MARSNNGGWDFVEEGKIYQYKEEGYISMVEILANCSNDKEYRFKVKVLASDGGFEPGVEFEVMSVKNLKGYYSGMSQFYQELEYCPLPIGRPWPKALSGHEREGLD